MDIIQTIQLTLNGTPPYQPIRMRQTDTGRVIKAVISDGGAGFNIPEDAVVEFNAKNPNKQIITRTDGITWEGSTVYFEVPANVLAIPGDVEAEFVVTSINSEQIGTVSFRIHVWNGVVTASDINDLPDYSGVQEARMVAEKARDEAQTSAENAKEAEEVILGVEYNPVRVDPDTNTLWNYVDGQWIDSGVSVEGTGDMLMSVYDPGGEVAESGGIPAYSNPRPVDAYSWIIPTAGYVFNRGYSFAVMKGNIMTMQLAVSRSDGGDIPNNTTIATFNLSAMKKTIIDQGATAQGSLANGNHMGAASICVIRPAGTIQILNSAIVTGVKTYYVYGVFIFSDA